LLEAWYLQYNEEDAGLTPGHIRKIQNRLYRTLPGNHNEFIKMGFCLAAAAAVIGILVTVGVKLWFPQPHPTGHLSDISPGSNKAFLTLSNGKRINLNVAVSGRLFGQSGVSILKTPGGQIIYKPAGNASLMGKDKSNNISTPNGGHWQVILPDGTKVWLNSESSFTYPVAFAGRNRIVELSGEDTLLANRFKTGT